MTVARLWFGRSLLFSYAKLTRTPSNLLNRSLCQGKVRSLTAFELYCISHERGYDESLIGLTYDERLKKYEERFEKLPPEEKNVYIKLEKDEAEDIYDYKLNQHPSKANGRKLSPYQFFVLVNKDQFRNSGQNILVALRNKWNSLDADQKAEYKVRSIEYNNKDLSEIDF